MEYTLNKNLCWVFVKFISCLLFLPEMLIVVKMFGALLVKNLLTWPRDFTLV